MIKIMPHSSRGNGQWSYRWQQQQSLGDKIYDEYHNVSTKYSCFEYTSHFNGIVVYS